jgi:glycosyltransferase involved in cell wall biosynthesis
VSPDGRPTVALVHDYFTQRGGAERVARRLALMYPEAALHTSVLDAAAAPDGIPRERYRTSGLQAMRRLGIPLKTFGPFLQGSFARRDLHAADVVISSSSAFAHHVRPGAHAIHICYCHTPPAFLWAQREYFHGHRLIGRVGTPALALLRRADRQAASAVDVYIANSRFTADRIREHYGREARVIYPPIETSAATPTRERSGRFLVVSRLRPHKRIDLAIAAANLSRLPLDVIGDGSDRRRLQALAGPTVSFLGRLPDAEVKAAMARCQALLVPGIEDFGMTTAELQAAGRPPIVRAAGGSTEIVCDGRTGFLVAEPTAAAFADAMCRSLVEELDAETLRASALRFDALRFDRDVGRIVEQSIAVLAAAERRARVGAARPLTTEPT